MTQPTPEVLRIVQEARRPIICGHVVPDADCFGSMLALATAMQAAGRRPRVVFRDSDISQRLSFLPPLADVPRIEAFDAELDWAIAVDTAKRGRINGSESLEALDGDPPLLNIDHHQTNERFGTADWVVPDASSTCELIYRLLRALDWPIAPGVATLLYAGIHDDTLGFSLPNTSAGALGAAGELADAGADIATLGDRLCRTQSMSELKLMQTIYANLRVVAGGRVAFSAVNHAELAASGCKPADIDDQVSVPRAIEGVRIGLLFSEGKPGVVRINFRGKGETTVVELAKQFNGGGHAHAAGAVVEGDFDDVIEQVVDAATQRVE